MITKEQTAEIAKTIKEMGYTPENAQAIMIEEYNISESRKLNTYQAKSFLGILKSGKYLHKEEDVPF